MLAVCKPKYEPPHKVTWASTIGEFVGCEYAGRELEKSVTRVDQLVGHQIGAVAVTYEPRANDKELWFITICARLGAAIAAEIAEKGDEALPHAAMYRVQDQYEDDTEFGFDIAKMVIRNVWEPIYLELFMFEDRDWDDLVDTFTKIYHDPATAVMFYNEPPAHLKNETVH